MPATPDLINGDFDRRVVVDTTALDWIASPSPGVERRPLDRVGGEVARATTVVRFAPASDFPTHVHGGGEEFLVLRGIFSDESGDYPAGSYVRNPPGSSHAPHTRDGCEIFVKLRQMKPDDLAHVVIDPETGGNWRALSAGRRALDLFRAVDGSEHVTLEDWQPGSEGDAETLVGGEELLILSGAFADEHGTYPAGTWVRNPPGFSRRLTSPQGGRFWRKTGHLKDIVSS